MKSIFILLFSSTLYANSIELVTGGLTYHINVDPAVSDKFSNKVSPDGALIFNQLYGFKYIKNDEILYDSYSFFMGHNSIDEQMGGFIYGFGLDLDHLSFGPALGGYVQDSSKFNDRGIGVLVGDFIPIFGFETNFKYMVSKKKFIKANTLWSLIIISETVSIGEKF